MEQCFGRDTSWSRQVPSQRILFDQERCEDQALLLPELLHIWAWTGTDDSQVINSCCQFCHGSPSFSLNLFCTIRQQIRGYFPEPDVVPVNDLMLCKEYRYDRKTLEILYQYQKTSLLPWNRKRKQCFGDHSFIYMKVKIDLTP